MVHAESYRIENEGGAWQELPAFHIEFPPEVDDDGREVEQAEPDGVNDPGRTFVGEDGCEGWFVVANLWHYSDPGLELHGYIIEGELPVVLESWSAE